jgi:hypothetical protein
MTVSRIDLRLFPGRAGRAPVGPTAPVERLSRRTLLVLAAAPETEVIPQRLGLLAWQLVQERLLLRHGLVHDDSLRERDPDGHTRLRSWSRRQPHTALGADPWGLQPLSGFIRDVFYPVAYQGQATVVAADLGRTLGLCAAWWRPCRGSARTRWFWRDGFALGLNGAGRVAKRERVDGSIREEWNPAPHSPMVRVKALGIRGYAVGFAVCPPYRGDRAGVWVKNPSTHRREPYRGRFVDVLSGATALDGLDTDALDEHCDAFGIAPQPLPVAVCREEAGPDDMVAACDATWQLALTLDQDAARW